MARKKQSEQEERQDLAHDQGVAVAERAAARAVSLELETIDTDEIRVPLANPRIDGAENREEFEALKASMRDHGLLEPIGVVKLAGSAGPGAYRLVWGSRRLRAARDLEWTGIQAMVFEEGGIDEERAAVEENLHRRAMNPLEELVAVEALMERHEALPPAEAQRKVGETLGRSATWVRDRLFLGRLGKEARGLVISGVLPLAHARELAKVVDHGTQEKLLRQWMLKGEVVVDVERARSDANECAFSLHQVPWSLDAAGVAKGCKACTDCEHNSANASQQGLFECDGKDPKLGRVYRRDPLGREYSWADRPKGPFCLNESCFKAKANAAREARSKVAKAVAKEKKPAERAEAAIKAAPTWMDSRVVKEAASPKTTEKPGAAKPKQKKQRSHAEEQRAWKEADARRRKREAESARREAARTEWLAKRHGALALVYIFGQSHHGRVGTLLRSCGAGQGKQAAKALPGPDLHKLLAAVRDDTLGMKDLDELVRDHFKCTYGENAFTRFLRRFGKASREVVDTMLAPPAAAEPADGAASKPAKKSKGGRKAKAAA